MTSEARKKSLKAYAQSDIGKETAKFAQLKFCWGVTREQYNELLEKQNHSCYMCKTHISKLDRGLFVDHNHQTGKVRGLLCHKCNVVIGFTEESIDRLEKIINYLKKHNGT